LARNAHQNETGALGPIMLSKPKDYMGCILIIFGMGLAILAAEPWSFDDVLQFLVFDFSPNQPLTGLGLAIAALGGVLMR
jgi:hypothetical protein